MSIRSEHPAVTEDQSENREPTNAELYDIIKGLQDRLDGALGKEGEPQPRREPAVDKLLKELEKPYSPEELKQAEQWVMRQMGGRLKVAKGPGGPDRDKAEVVFDRYVVEPKDRASGKTTLPDGFTLIHTVPVYVLARYYTSIILDDTSYQTDEEKLFALVADSRERGGDRAALHPELEHLFTPDGALKKLKPRRKRGRKRSGKGN